MSGIYISWPFCAQKCTYCNFASGVPARGTEDRYLDALVNEIRAHEWRFTPDTLYIGGGTPSAAPLGMMERIADALPGRPWREATIETAPGSFDAAKIRGWQRAGFNRVSLGVQSFVKRELARTGRKHDAEMVRSDIDLLRARGITNINVDLIAGLPGQTRESWEESLAATLALDVPHVSIYMLEVDEDSRLGSEIILGGTRYGASDVPSEDAVADFYEHAVERLATRNISRYEISNFARPGAESAHNLKYWRRESYIGFGADAHSYDGGLRWQNPETVQTYIDSPRRVTESTPDETEERFFVGLRLSEGVAPTEDDWLRFGASFRRFIEAGLIEHANGRLRLTARGVMVSNEVFKEFLGCPQAE